MTVVESAGAVYLMVEREGASVNNFTILLTTTDGTALGVAIVIITSVIIIDILHTRS